MKIKHLNFLKDYINSLGKIEGISDNEIELLEEKFQLKLPDAYKEYLFLFGKSTGNLLSSYLMTIDRIEENIECIKFDLANTIHNNSFSINKDMFFFGQWQGSVFCFLCNGDENPPVYFIQDFDNIKVTYQKFTDFIYEEGLKLIIDNIEKGYIF